MALAGCEHVDDGRGRFFRANVRIAAGAKQCFELEMDHCDRFAQPRATPQGSLKPDPGATAGYRMSSSGVSLVSANRRVVVSASRDGGFTLA
jgi:hypothetical protein